MIARLVNIVVRFPLLVAGIALCALLAAAFGLAQLVFDDGHEKVFASSTPQYQRYIGFKRKFSNTDANIAILVSSTTGFDEGSIDRLRELALDVHLVEGVEAVFSVFSLQRFNPVSGEIEPVFAEMDRRDLSILLEEAAQTSFSGLSLMSADGRKTALIVSFEEEYAQLQQAQKGLTALRQLTGEFSRSTAMKAAVSGLLPFRDRVVQQLRLDQPVINGLGALLGFCISLYIFKNFWIALLNGVAPVVALILSLGFIGLFGFSINVINTALPVLVLVLASSDCTHITYEICGQSREYPKVRDAIERAMIETAPACILTSITTALAFASLSISTSPIIRELSISGVVSVLAGLGAVLLIHPLVFMAATRFASVRSALIRPLRAENTLHWRREFFAWLSSRGLAVFAGGLLLGLAALWLSFPIQTGYRFAENINSDDGLVRTLAELESFSGPMTSLEFPIEILDDKQLLSSQSLSEIGAIHETLEDFEAGFAVTSVHTLMRFFRSQGHEPSLDDLNDVLEILPQQYRHRIISKDDDGYLLSVLVSDIGSQELRNLSRRIWQEIAKYPASTIGVLRPTGMLMLSAEVSDVLIKQLVYSFLAAALACPLLIGLWFRRLDFALYAVVPNMLPVFIIGAWLHQSGRDIQFSSALALTIAFGIAVDDTIHVFNRLNLEAKRSAGQLNKEIVIAAMTRISPALVTTTAILSAGLITVLWSDMPMIEYFGLLCIATFILALLADVLLLPGMIAWGIGASGQKRRCAT